jgi:hypothetical protein
MAKWDRPPDQVVRPCNGHNDMPVEKWDKIPVTKCETCPTILSKYRVRQGYTKCILCFKKCTYVPRELSVEEELIRERKSQRLKGRNGRG